jgi:hypothetical protein
VKIAFLVLAAKSPEVLKKYVPLFSSPEFHFFVHIDKKASGDEYGFLFAHANVTVIAERYKVFWGGFNMVLAELALLKAAVSDYDFERFVLVSDDTFPLHSPARILATLREDCLWIGQYEVSRQHPVSARYEGFYFFDSDATSAQFRVPEQRWILPADLDHIRDLERLVQRGKKPIARLFQGSQWWGLPRDAVSHILSVVGEDEHLRESFRFSCVPDEHYFQTIIGMAQRPWRIRGTPMYVDFSREPKPYVFRTVDEIAPARQSGQLFIRKVASDPDLLAALAEGLAS